LKKVHRVIKKVIPEAPHQVWLVVDGTIGQNSLQQAKEFQKALELTGLIVTKLDGTAKGGAVLAVSSELGIPIRFIGVGEGASDFMPFDPKSFIEAILG
jgi:fused signal recognition particle receptor